MATATEQRLTRDQGVGTLVIESCDMADVWPDLSDGHRETGAGHAAVAVRCAIDDNSGGAVCSALPVRP